MGLETAALIGMGAGGLGGAIKGAKGTPDQKVTSQNSIAPAGAQEAALQSQSLQNYQQANNLAQGIEGGFGSAQSYQDLARQAGQNIMGGQAFNITPEEQARIQGLRDALIQQGTADVGFNTQQGLQQVAGSAAGRGMRGQALSSMQGQVLQNQQRVVGDVSNQANTMAAQQYINTPLQRIQAQQGLIGQGMSLADQLRQNAFANRQALQDPALMQYLQRERMANSTQTQITPGQRGGFMGAIGGALGGAGQGFGIGANIASGFRDLNAGSRPSGAYGYGQSAAGNSSKSTTGAIAKSPYDFLMPS
jgi:hypothetical protein